MGDDCGAYVWALKRAIKDRFKSQGRTRGLLYRDCSVRNEYLHLLRQDGRKFVFPSFISASADRDISISFANIAYQPGSKRVLLTIDCDNEVGLSYYVDIRDVALPEFQDEKETVFFP